MPKLSIIPSAEIEPLLELYLTGATDEQVQFGKRWYERAYVFCLDVALSTGYRNTINVAHALAALSPQLRWSFNKAATEDLVRLYVADAPLQDALRLGYIKRNIAKAWACLSGERSALVGPKVEAFVANVLGDYQRVTLDTWAFKAAGFGRYVESKRQRGEIERAYRNVARRYGLAPAHCQAIIWTVVNPQSISEG